MAISLASLDSAEYKHRTLLNNEQSIGWEKLFLFHRQQTALLQSMGQLIREDTRVSFAGLASKQESWIEDIVKSVIHQPPENTSSPLPPLGVRKSLSMNVIAKGKRSGAPSANSTRAMANIVKGHQQSMAVALANKSGASASTGKHERLTVPKGANTSSSSAGGSGFVYANFPVTTMAQRVSQSYVISQQISHCKQHPSRVSPPPRLAPLQGRAGEGDVAKQRSATSMSHPYDVRRGPEEQQCRYQSQRCNSLLADEGIHMETSSNITAVSSHATTTASVANTRRQEEIESIKREMKAKTQTLLEHRRRINPDMTSEDWISASLEFLAGRSTSCGAGTDRSIIQQLVASPDGTLSKKASSVGMTSTSSQHSVQRNPQASEEHHEVRRHITFIDDEATDVAKGKSQKSEMNLPTVVETALDTSDLPYDPADDYVDDGDTADDG